MNRLAVILVLSSCAVHAGWNLIAKRSSRTPAFFLLATVGAWPVLAPVFFLLGGKELAGAPAGLWPCLLLTGAFQAAYFACLAAAYRHGDVSVAYPLVRTTPVFVLLLAGLFLQQYPTWPAVTGVLLAVAGCFLLPFRKLGLGPEAFEWKTYVNRTSLWALGAALASSGYTLTDKIGMGYIAQVVPGPRGAFLYNCLESVPTGAGLLAVTLLFDRPAGLAGVWRTEKRRALLVGAMFFTAYTLILWAYLNADKVAYVAGLRQLSIVLGVIGGVAIFKERGGPVRVVASVVIVVGLVLIALAK